jgi:serine/threonine-protein kinase
MSHLLDRLQKALAGRYAIEREIGRGGMSIVYLARDEKHGRAVAVKVLRPELAASLGSERFLREIEIASRFQHPHIVPLYDSGMVEESPYYVMPYIEGESLRERLEREKQLPIEEALSIAREVADALSYAHSRDVVHRDIKPENILMTGNHPVVTDFGIARAVAVAGGDQLTTSGMTLGTPAYMSPEQGGAGEQIDGRSDVYSLGCVLYEMLCGEPPFTGTSARLVIARHMQETPPSLRIARPTVAHAVQGAIEKALAKVPADRYGTSHEFAEQLEELMMTGPHVGVATPRRKLAWRRIASVVGAGAIAIGMLPFLLGSSEFLDPRHVAVYPLVVSSEADQRDRVGEALATVIGHAFDRAGSLRWTDAWRWLDHAHREDIRLLTSAEQRTIAQRHQAAFYVEGRVLRRGDTMEVFMGLYDVRGDSTVGRAHAAGHHRDVWQLGLTAATELLRHLIESGRSVDLSDLRRTAPAAAADFLRGEAAFRRLRFAEAVDNYGAALEADSAFALAALRGAQAAGWKHWPDQAATFIGVALDHSESLNPRQQLFARGVQAFMTGEAVEALGHLRRARAIDPEKPDVWAQMGEVYTHLLPDEGVLDSLAEDAFAAAHQLDSGLTAPLFHLIEIALRRGDIARARELRPLLVGAGADWELETQVEMMAECVERGPGGVDWRNAVRETPAAVTQVARVLAGGAAHLGCAEAGWRALLRYDTTTGSTGLEQRWAGVFGLQSLLVATGRYEDAKQVLDSAKTTPGLAGFAHMPFVPDAVAGAPLDSGAAAFVEGLGDDYDALIGPQLWLVGTWRAKEKRGAPVEQIASLLATRAAASGSDADKVLSQSMTAQAALARSDTTEALRRLRSLTPTAPYDGLAWWPWESLAGERIALAELLLARQEYAEAVRVASVFDSPASVVYLVYLPASLAIRLQAARGLGDARLERSVRERLAALRPDDAGTSDN